MKIARPYQRSCIDTVFAELQAGVKNQLVVLPTGGGKTFVASQIINKFPGRILWCTHNMELINQSAIAILKEEEFCNQTLLDHLNDDVINNSNSEDLFENHGVDAETLAKFKAHIGVIKQTRFDIDAKIVVASVQTLHRRLDRIAPDYFDVVVVDEAHLFLSKTFLKCVNHFTPKLLLGLTATPHRLDGQSLGNIFDKIVFQKDIKYGIDNGFLAELDAIRIKTDLSLDSVRTTGGELNEGDLDRLVDTPKRNKLIVDSYKKYAAGRQALVFCVTVKHAMHVAEAFQQQGLSASFVVADEQLCPDRTSRISLFKSGEIQVLTNVGILTTGFDYPEAACCIMARPTKSLTLYLQCIGRVTRLKQNWKDAIIVDIVDATSRHKLINAWELDKEKPIEERTFTTREKKDALIFKMAEARKAKLDKDALHKRDKKVNLFKVPKMKVITSERMKEPATEAQLNWIAKWGYDIVNNEYTKAMCSEIISNQEASDKQKKWLSWKGYDVQETLTIGEFQAAVTEIETREKAATTPKVAAPTPSYMPFKDLK